MTRLNSIVFRTLLISCLVPLLPSHSLRAQDWEAPGKPIGKASVAGNLILLELDEGALGQQKLFDLGQRSLRFTAAGAGAGYRVEKVPLNWDADFGQALTGHEVTLKNFAFPFSGKNWKSFSVGLTGSIRFGEKSSAAGEWGAPPRGDEGGVSIGRFDPLSEGAANLVNTVPAICVFFKPRMSGNEFVKELADRVVVTWDVTEPWGNIQDFTWTKTVNRFQAVLHKDGVIEMSYQELAAKDAIVGVYPLISGGAETALATLAGAKNSASSALDSVPTSPNLDIRNVKLSVVDGIFLKATFETVGPVLPEEDPGVAGIGYHLYFAAHKLSSTVASAADADAVWTIRGFAPHRTNAGKSRYLAIGPGLSRGVKVSGNSISIQGILPPTLRGATHIAVFADSSARDSDKPLAQIPARPVALDRLGNPEVQLSALTWHDGPFPVVYEAFHYYALPNARDLTCSVIKTLGDKYDFLAYYSDFRVDNQEAGTPSDGPLGAVGGAVTGIGAKQSGLDKYCTPGRFQWQYIQPVYVGSNQMQERPPQDAPVGNDHDITYYQQQLAEISQEGKIPPYLYALSQIAHEMGHRWAAFVSAKVGEETIPLGPTHWARGLQAVVPFPYVRPTEASIMGGGVWLDNFDGTYTQLDDDYYVPATGYSYLDLYLMGLISPAEVPDFFILRNLVAAGKDADGHPIFKADRTKLTIQDVIAAQGPRVPDIDTSQRKFNTGMVIVVQHGAAPSSELIERTNGIRKQWMEYFSITTGRRASMTTNPD
jgi:hypothetical protein